MPPSDSFRHMPRALLWIACLLWLALSTLAGAQEPPLTRVFHPGANNTYRVRLELRTELEGQRTEKIGAVTYAVPFRRAAESRLSWRATRRVVSLSPDGTAEIEETLDGFEAVSSTSAGDDEESRSLAEGLRALLAAWAGPRTLRYRESSRGQLLGVGPEGVPRIDETPPPLLTLWLVRALRPAAAIPTHPILFGERWQEPRQVRLEPWTDLSAAESGEWLEAPGSFGAVARLHIVQQISGRVPPPARSTGTPPNGEAGEAGESEARFHAESLTTVSLQDGSVLAATRSATREVTRTLGPVAGLPEAPRFRATLSVQVEIEGCDDASCAPRGRARR